jgi:hypothetical protein
VATRFEDAAIGTGAGNSGRRYFKTDAGLVHPNAS